MLKVIGSKQCSDTMAALEMLNEKKIDYEFIDILDSLDHLKEYLYWRDTQPCYEDIVKNHGIGIPLFVQDGKASLEMEL